MAPHSSTLAWKIPWMEEPGGLHGVAKSRTWLSDFTFHFHALEKEMATHSSVLAWRIPGTEEPGGLPSRGSHRVGHDWSDLAAARNNGGKEGKEKLTDKLLNKIVEIKWRGTQKPLDEGERESEKVGLNLNTQKTKIMASGPITSWQIDGETV